MERENIRFPADFLATKLDYLIICLTFALYHIESPPSVCLALYHIESPPASSLALYHIESPTAPVENELERRYL